MFTITKKEKNEDTKKELDLLFDKTLNNKVVLYRSKSEYKEVEYLFMPVSGNSTRNIVVQRGPRLSLHKKGFKWEDMFEGDSWRYRRTYIDGVNCDYEIKNAIYFHKKHSPTIIMNFLNPVAYNIRAEIADHLPHLTIERCGQSAFAVRNRLEISGFKKTKLPIDFVVNHEYDKITVEKANGLVQEVYDTMSFVDIYEKLLNKYLDGKMEEKIKEHEHAEFNTPHCRCFEYDGKTDLLPYYISCKYFRLYDEVIHFTKCGPMGRGHQRKGFFVPLSIVNDPKIKKIEVKLPEYYKASFIGKKGKNIKRIEAEINKKIKII